MLDKCEIPKVGDIAYSGRILYFIKGVVKDSAIHTEVGDRNWLYRNADKTRAYFITSETPRQFYTVAVDLHDSDRIANVDTRIVVVNKREMECIRTPGMCQDVGSPVMGMFSFIKDTRTVMNAMRSTINQDIASLADQITEMERTLINS